MVILSCFIMFAIYKFKQFLLTLILIHCFQRQYVEFKVQINSLVAQLQKTPADGWIMRVMELHGLEIILGTVQQCYRFYVFNSAILTNGDYILNINFNQYKNNSKALLEAMWFMMDPSMTKRACYVQFPQKIYLFKRSVCYQQ